MKKTKKKEKYKRVHNSEVKKPHDDTKKMNKKIEFLSKQISESERDLSKLNSLQKGIASSINKELDEVRSRILSLQKNLESFRKVSKKSLSNSLKTVKKESKEEVARLARDIEDKIDGINEEMKDFNKKIIGLTDVLNENISDIERKFDENILLISDKKVDEKAFDKVIKSVNDRITDVTNMLENLRNEIIVLLDSFNKKVEILNEDVNKKLQSNMELLDEKVSVNLLDLNRKIDESVNTFISVLEGMKSNIDERIKRLDEETTAKVDDLNGFATTSINSFQTKIDKMETQRISKEIELEDKINTNIDNMKNIFEEKTKEMEIRTLNRVEALREFINNKLSSFQTTLDGIEEKYNNLVDQSKKTDSALVILNKELSDSINRFNSATNELKADINERIKRVDNEAMTRIDDLSGYVNNTLGSIQTTLDRIESQHSTKELELENKIRDMDNNVKRFIDRMNEIESNFSYIARYYSKVKEDTNKKINEAIEEMKKETELIGDSINKKMQDRISSFQESLKTQDVLLKQLLEKLENNSMKINEALEDMKELEKRIKSLEYPKIQNLEKEIGEIKTLKDLTLKLAESTKEDISRLRSQIEMQRRQEELEEESIIKTITERLKG